ncbi:D-arabinono-1,4-lactone oxidase [Terriglobus roseus]|uniref:Xylitol oxidase n=1 Tax=Terriglobus roseus TaxID=392734 RepID=A0A1H4KMT4_9BACT|nr:D-arabinono-1,4-lactone oxidase [Terriglobus roseus]SEB59418.1 xylitol oxidase [Terriglobus roseus]
MDRRELLKSSAILMAAAPLARAANVSQDHANVLDDHANVPRTNWSKNFHYSTSRVYAPITPEEVPAIVQANGYLKGLGSRHCFNNIADSQYAQISMREVKGIQIDEEARTVTVGAGIAYGELAPVLDKAGYALANLASLPHISVGGTIATGTHGSGVGNKNLSSATRAVEIVKADGSVLQLSRDKDGERFQLAVVHLGALGVLTRVTLDIVPRYDMSQVVYRNLSFDQLEDNLDTILGSGYSVSLFTDWQKNRVNQVWIKDKVAADATQQPQPPMFYGATLQTAKLHPIDDHPADACTEQMGSAGPWYLRLPHFKMEFTPSSGEELQTEYFVARKDGYKAIRAVEKLRDRITPHLFITEIRTIASDDLPMSMAHGRDSMAIHFTWKPEEPVVRKLLPEIEAVLKPFGVRPHWGKIFELDPKYLRQQYASLPRFRALAQEFDPGGKFRNAYLERNIFGA